MRVGSHLGLNLETSWGLSCRQDGPSCTKMAPRCCYVGQLGAQDGQLNTILGGILDHVSYLERDLTLQEFWISQASRDFPRSETRGLSLPGFQKPPQVIQAAFKIDRKMEPNLDPPKSSLQRYQKGSNFQARNAPPSKPDLKKKLRFCLYHLRKKRQSGF